MDFLFELKLKECNKIFKDGMNPGVLVSQIITFDITEEEAESGLFISSLHNARNEFIESQIEINITEINQQK